MLYPSNSPKRSCFTEEFFIKGVVHKCRYHPLEGKGLKIEGILDTLLKQNDMREGRGGLKVRVM